MAFSSFRWNVTIRVLLIAGSMLLAVWGWTVSTWAATPLVAAVLAIALLAELIAYIERTNREFAFFLRSIAHHDYSVPVPDRKKGGVFDQLEAAYRVLTAELTRLNAQKAANHQYLESVVEHLAVALVCFDDAGKVTMINETARRLFRLPHAHNRESFGRVDARLPALLEKLTHDERELLQIQCDGENLHLVLYTTVFSLLGRQYKLVSFQNIRDELEQRELESWQRLVRVLAHEIMNSVTPIVSLSSLLHETLSTANDTDSPLDAETRRDLQRSASVVHSRSIGLMEFVKAYRNFTAVPKPAPRHVGARGLLENTRTLMSDNLTSHGVACEIRSEMPEPVIHADARQIEQVLINLMRNAAEALEGTPGARLVLEASRHDQRRIALRVIDNGPGIDAATADNIFVPFFTTKRGGTGVGLSISRQLIRANGGFISHQPGEPRGSVFTLLLPSA
jgi:two-component system, NtrC family, nitrogen regulation sensor histidine kinase NtrY